MFGNFAQRIRPLFAAPAVVLMIFAAVAAPARSGGDEEPPADERATDEILRDILLKRDLASPGSFETLGKRRTKDSLRALQRATDSLQTRQSVDAVYLAFRHFRGAGELEQDALGFLVAETHDPIPYRRRAAMRGVVAFGGAALDKMRKVLGGHEDTICRQIAVGGLLRMLHMQRTPEALSLILAHYRVPYSGTREQGVDTLSVFRDADSMERFEDALGDRKGATQAKTMVLEALARIGGEHAVEMIVDALGAKQPAVQLAAIRAAAALGYTEHGRKLSRLQRSRDPAVRHAAMIAQSGFRAAEEEWRKEVFRAAGVRDFALRMAAATCLAQLGDEEAIELLYTMLADRDPLVRRETVRAMAGLRRKDSLSLLVGQLEMESMRMREELRDALETLTGMNLGTAPERWQRWWDKEGPMYDLPSLAVAEADSKERKERRAASPTQTVFYGIPIDSDRVCFVLDVSGSMSEASYSGGMRIDALRKELMEAIEELSDGVYFNMLFFDSTVYGWKKKLTRMDKKQRASALDYASKQGSGGGTALYDGLIAAFGDPNVDTIVLLSDGEPTEGKLVDPQEILESILQLNELRDVVIHSISVSWASDLLRELAERTGGTYLEVR